MIRAVALLLATLLLGACSAGTPAGESLPVYTPDPLPSSSPIAGFGGTISKIECDLGGHDDSYHIHTILEITGPAGEKITVPADIGVGTDCMYWVHTHDTTGKIHLEAPADVTPTLADLLEIWRRSFDPTVPDSILGGMAEITVDGQPVLDLGIILTDGQTIQVTILAFFQEA